MELEVVVEVEDIGVEDIGVEIVKIWHLADTQLEGFTMGSNDTLLEFCILLLILVKRVAAS